MYSLILDTSFDNTLVALAKEGRVIFSEVKFSPRDHSAFLFSTIDSLLQQAQILPKDLSFIAVGTGPGSYTGIRIGVTAAKTLSFALDIPVLGFCSLAAFLPFETGSFLALLDRKMGHYFAIRGEKTGDLLDYTVESRADGPAPTPDTFSFSFSEVDFAVVFSKQLTHFVQKTSHEHGSPKIGWLAPSPNLSPIAQRTYSLFAKGEFGKDNDLQPNYAIS